MEDYPILTGSYKKSEKIFLDTKFLLKQNKFLSQTTITKIFTNESELDILLAGCCCHLAAPLNYIIFDIEKFVSISFDQRNTIQYKFRFKKSDLLLPCKITPNTSYLDQK